MNSLALRLMLRPQFQGGGKVLWMPVTSHSKAMMQPVVESLQKHFVTVQCLGRLPINRRELSFCSQNDYLNFRINKRLMSNGVEVSSQEGADNLKEIDAAEDVKNYMAKHDIKVDDPLASPPSLSFQSSGLPPKLLEAVMRQFDAPTPIQAQALPLALEGRNMVGIGQTGSGKTLAFLLPALVHIMNQRQLQPKESSGYNGPKALVLAPTRELAKQIEEVALSYRKLCGVRTICCIGGESRHKQLNSYDFEPQLMIATPGRLNDFLNSGDMDIRNVGYVVLDEADRMLDMGFEPQVNSILSNLPTTRQILMFSATWPEEVKELAEDFLGKFTFVSIGSTDLRANKNISQEVVVCQQSSKQTEFLERIAPLQRNKLLIFAERKSSVDRLERMLRNRGIRAMGIHGDKSQAARSNILRKFKDGTCKTMIATDVAARGLDINDVEYVVNYDFPLDIENYIHRIGRTARSNKTGTSITFITENEAKFAKNLIKVLKESNQPVDPELIDLARQSRPERSQWSPVRSRYRLKTDERPTRTSLDKFRYKGLQGENWRNEPRESRRAGPNQYKGFVYDTRRQD